jgi:hypothetical protein
MMTHGGQGFHCAIAFNIASRWDGPEDFVEISVAGSVLNEIIVEKCYENVYARVKDLRPYLGFGN